MAWTITRYPTVFGNKRVVGIKATADAATQNIETGLKVIEWFHFSVGSVTTEVGLNLFINSATSGTQVFGTVGCSGFSSGDDVYLTVYGR